MTAVLEPTRTTTSTPTPTPTPTSRRVVTLRPAPRREPPYDDELEIGDATGRYDQRLPFAPVTLVPEPVVLRKHGLPEPTNWARRLLVGLVESADGRRPLNQLASMLSPSVGRGLGSEFERAAIAGDGHWLQHGSVRTVRGDEFTDGIAELCATLDVGNRVRAVALRLENRRGRWLCTRLHLG